MKSRTDARRALDADLAAHVLYDALGDCKTEAGSPDLAARDRVSLLEFQKNPALLLRRNADAGIAHNKSDLLKLSSLNRDRDAARVSELDRIAGKIEQNLAQSSCVTEDAGRQTVLHIRADFEILLMCPRRDKLDGFFDHGTQVEWTHLRHKASSLDFGKIENLVDQRKQELSAILHRRGIGGLLRREIGVEQKVGHPQNAVEGCSDLVRDHREEAGLRAISRFRLIAGLGQSALRFHPLGDIASHALHLRRLTRPNNDFTPGDPSLAFGCRDLLIMDARAIAEQPRLALRDDG